jgi:hypothetical protein
MVRTQLQLEEHVHRKVRLLALKRRISMAELIRQFIREGLSEALATDDAGELGFIAAGASGRTDLSERHDDYLAEDL